MREYTIHDSIMKRPASVFPHRWRDSSPIGTGSTGALLYGGVSAETVILNRNTMWYGGEDDTLPDVSEYLGKMRALREARRFEEANMLMYNALCEKGYNTKLGNMRTLGCVKLSLPCYGVYSHYRRVIHMDTAETEVSYKIDGHSFRRRYIASRSRDLIAVELTAEQEMDFGVTSGFFLSFEGVKERNLALADKETAEYSATRDCYIYSSENEGKYFGIVCRVIADGASFTDGAGIRVTKSKKALLLIKAFSGECDRKTGEKRVCEELCACPSAYDEIFRENLPEYQRLYNAADISLYTGEEMHSNEELLAAAREDTLSPELTEKIWRFGRYLFISGTSIEGLPFPLYGLWVGGYECSFTHHVANENVQSIYWHTQKGGLFEFDKSLIEYYFANMEKYRENARKLYGARGIFIGTYTTPVNAAVAWFVPVILHFNGVAGWLSQHFYNYYLRTGDTKLLEEKILPFMMEAAAFYEDFAYQDKDGNFVLYPAVSPENSPIEYHDRSKDHSMPTTENPTIEIAILRELLTNLIAEAKTRPALSEKAEGWKALLAKLPPYRINGDGALSEWVSEAHGDAYGHRHISHLYPVFPGTEINFRDNRDLMPACKKALDLRTKGSFWGWTLPHMGAVYARFEDGENVFYCMNALAKVCLLENLFTLGHDYRDMGITGYDSGNAYRAPVQLDALMGFVNVTQDMLLYALPNALKILPACPMEYGEGSAKLHFYGGTVTIHWNLSKKECCGTIEADRDTAFELYLPFDGGRKEVTLRKGETYTYQC